MLAEGKWFLEAPLARGQIKTAVFLNYQGLDSGQFGCKIGKGKHRIRIYLRPQSDFDGFFKSACISPATSRFQ
jgi:hypothetical protein